jgi:hypothetical protein
MRVEQLVVWLKSTTISHAMMDLPWLWAAV